MSRFCDSWVVRQDWTTSDHNSVDIRLRVPKTRDPPQPITTARFDARRADWDKYSEVLSDLVGPELEVLRLESPEDVEGFAQGLTRVLTHASQQAMPRKRRFRKSNPWWTRNLTTLKKIVYRSRRALQAAQARAEPGAPRMRIDYRKHLRRYTAEVRRAKIASWRTFVTEVGNAEPWGYVYRHAARKLRVDEVLSSLRCNVTSTNNLEATARRLLEVHVPEDREIEDTPLQRAVRDSSRIISPIEDMPPFTTSELLRVVRVLKNRKAPGLDQIEVKALKVAVKTIPGQFVRLFNGCLRWGVFPSIWKEGSLRVFLKGEGKCVEDPKSYRPICLLSVVGKLFEKLLVWRLTPDLLAPEALSDRQYGFLPGRSAEDAIVELRRLVAASDRRYAVALLFDISGAFDNVWWPLVLEGWKACGCPANAYRVLQDYFSNRFVRLTYGDITVTRQATRGCPQGSVLGPACWNVMFDGLLKHLESAIGRKFVAYADDLLVLVEGDSRRDIETAGQRVVDLIITWCAGAKLQISSSKTEAIVLRSEPVRRAPVGRRGGARPDRRRKQMRARKTDLAARPPTIRIGDAKLKFRQSVRYLGVHFDVELGVSTHCKYLRDKVGSRFSMLARRAGCEWGLRFWALSTIYRGVFGPTVTYAAAGWADLCVGSDWKVLRTLQRRVLLPTTAAYRTTSIDALCVAAGAIPVDILLREAQARYLARHELDASIGGVAIPFTESPRTTYALIRSESLRVWQDRWRSSTAGRTTYAFFPDVARRVDARGIRLSHGVTQMITGHGDFRARLASFALVDSEMCACGAGPDTAQHHLFECAVFDAQREALRQFVPDAAWGWPQAAPFLVSDREAFEVFSNFCRHTLWLKSFQ